MTLISIHVKFDDIEFRTYPERWPTERIQRVVAHVEAGGFPLFLFSSWSKIVWENRIWLSLSFNKQHRNRPNASTGSCRINQNSNGNVQYIYKYNWIADSCLPKPTLNLHNPIPTFGTVCSEWRKLLGFYYPLEALSSGRSNNLTNWNFDWFLWN